ncbi:MAG: NAD(P)H-dependent oxidoreductase [Polaromonas sp.]|nr:NAD(P)H-dependent oxidoreductase [Polaromonas sp.]
MTAPPKLLIFAGSTRRNSLNGRLAQAAADLALASGAEVTLLELADLAIPMYQGDLETEGMPADVMRLKQILFAHSGWIICSPEYNGSYPALLKNTIDWATRPVKSDPAWADGLKPFSGKVVGVLSASPGALGGLRAQSHLVPLLIALQCWVAPKAFALSRAAEAFDADGGLIQDAHRQSVRGVIDQVLFAAGRLAPTPGAAETASRTQFSK